MSFFHQTIPHGRAPATQGVHEIQHPPGMRKQNAFVHQADNVSVLLALIALGAVSVAWIETIHINQAGCAVGGAAHGVDQLGRLCGQGSRRRVSPIRWMASAPGGRAKVSGRRRVFQIGSWPISRGQAC